MNGTVPVLFVAATWLSDIPADADTDVAPLLDPSEHIRIEYNEFNTPDSRVFEAMLAVMQSYLDARSRTELEGWVFTEMNMTYNRKIEAWVTPQAETIRHSRGDIGEFVDLLLDVADKLEETTARTQLDLFCPSDKFSATDTEQIYAAAESWDKVKFENADFYLDYTMEQIGEQASADLRAWISRKKDGYSATEYNDRSLWAGRESELIARFAEICTARGSN